MFEELLGQLGGGAGISELGGLLAQDPDKIAPMLASMGVAPPSADALANLTPLNSPFGGGDGGVNERWNDVANRADGSAPQGATTSPFMSFMTKPHYGDPAQTGYTSDSETQARMAQPTAAQPAVPASVAATVPSAESPMNSPFAPHNLLRRLVGVGPTGAPAPAPAAPTMPPVSMVGAKDVYDAPSPFAPDTQTPQPATGVPMPPPRPRELTPSSGWDTSPEAMTRYRDAISSNESGGNYGAVGPTHPKYGRALGKYQVMESNLPEWSQAALGRTVTPDEFLRDKNIQDQIFDSRFKSYVEKYGPEGASRAWFGGEGNVDNLNKTDALGTTVGGYSQKFATALSGGGGLSGSGTNYAGTPEAGGGGTSTDFSAVTKKPGANDLAKMLGGLRAPSAPENQKIQSPAVPRPSAMPGAGNIQLMQQAVSGKSDPLVLLRLMQALGGGK